MELISVEKFRRQWEEKESITGPVDSGAIYTNSGFHNLKTKWHVYKSECSIGLDLPDNGKIISKDIPLFDQEEIDNIMKDDKQVFVHLGAFVFGLVAHFPVDEEVEGLVSIIDKRRSDLRRATLACRKIKFVNGRCAFMMKPNFSVRKEDLRDGDTFCAAIKVKNLGFEGGFFPFSACGGVIYRTSNVSFAHAVDKTFASRTIHDLVGTDVLSLDQLDQATLEDLEEVRRSPILRLMAPDERVMIERGNWFHKKPAIRRRSFGKRGSQRCSSIRSASLPRFSCSDRVERGFESESLAGIVLDKKYGPNNICSNQGRSSESDSGSLQQPVGQSDNSSSERWGSGTDVTIPLRKNRNIFSK
uniref:Movement protein n=1 Tax=Potato virus T TaxID=36403 RepID=A0A8F8MZN5_9VIRU|nr:movement protein [Potato virus T]